MAVAAFLIVIVSQVYAASEYEIKAAFLLTFARFVEWPDRTGPNQGAFMIGILGRDPFGTEIDRAIAGRTIDGEPISVQRFTDVRQIPNCQILYVSPSEASRIPAILEAIGTRPVLLIGDTPEFAGAGGAIGLLVENSKVQFEVNYAALTRAGIRVHPQLLVLARAVRKRPRGS